MSIEDERRQVARQARKLFRSGIAESAVLTKLGKVLKPIPIRTANGEVNSWFVAIQVRDKLAGYIQLSPDLVLMRYASFWRGEPGFASCPDANSWFDPVRILQKARAIAMPSESLGEPFLSFDKDPSRIAWAVKIRDAGNAADIIFVSGDSAFRGHR